MAALDRGEAANYGLLDAFDLYNALHAIHAGKKEKNTAIGEYEKELLARSRAAVILSRQACLDGHEWGRLDGSSPILAARSRPSAIISNTQ